LDRGMGIALDDAGNSFVTGVLGDAAADFGPFTLTSAGGDDSFVAEYDNAGNVVWARSAGGTGSDRGFGIALDSGGNSYVTGLHSDMATFGSFTLTSAGDHDIFVAKYNGCGDGSIDPGEECDGGLGCMDCRCDADFEPMTPPSLDCQPTCGNGRIDPGEECDDGNTQPGDGCDETCRLELGACCVGTGCSVVTESDCLTLGGSFFGVDSTCDVPDADGDGLRDECDECPNDAAKIQAGICGCNVDDNADGDGDGVPDCSDECPGVDDAVFAPGCGDAIPTVSGWGLIVLALLLLTGAKIHFGRKEAVRTPE